MELKPGEAKNSGRVGGDYIQLYLFVVISGNNESYGNCAISNLGNEPAVRDIFRADRVFEGKVKFSQQFILAEVVVGL